MTQDHTDKAREQEYQLNTEQCAKIALYMYEKWQEAMKPPLLIFKSFPDWLKQLEEQS